MIRLQIFNYSLRVSEGICYQKVFDTTNPRVYVRNQQLQNPIRNIIVDAVITFTQDSVRLQTAPTDGCADIFGLYYNYT